MSDRKKVRNMKFKGPVMLAFVVSILLSSSAVLICNGITENGMPAFSGDPMTYSVTYSVNGGDGTAPTETDRAPGTTFTAASASGLSRAGYEFRHWNTLANGNGTSYSAGSVVTMPAYDLVLYAIWVDTWVIETDTWVRGSTDGFVLTVNWDAAEFEKAEMDDVPLIEGTDYKVDSTPGSTIITLFPSYLETLDEGEHWLSAKYTGPAQVGVVMYITEPSGPGGLGGIGVNTMVLIVIVVMILAGSGVIYLFKH